MFYHVLPSILEFCLFHHRIDAQFQNFARSISRAKDLIPQRKNMEFTPLVLEKKMCHILILMFYRQNCLYLLKLPCFSSIDSYKHGLYHLNSSLCYFKLISLDAICYSNSGCPFTPKFLFDPFKYLYSECPRVSKFL